MSIVYINGTYGLEHCSPGTSCAAHSVCNRSCTSNTWWCAYPHFTECTNHNCNDQTGLPKAHGGCITSFIGFQDCRSANVFLEGRLQECGPLAANKTAESTCGHAGTTAKIVACCNPALFRSICHCSPLRAGIGYTKVSVFT
jgi:hypothetical protein